MTPGGACTGCRRSPCPSPLPTLHVPELLLYHYYNVNTCGCLCISKGKGVVGVTRSGCGRRSRCQLRCGHRSPAARPTMSQCHSSLVGRETMTSRSIGPGTTLRMCCMDGCSIAMRATRAQVDLLSTAALATNNPLDVLESTSVTETGVGSPSARRGRELRAACGCATRLPL